MRVVGRSLLPWLVAGAVGWGGTAWIGLVLWANDPPRAGFDLALLLEAARRVVAGGGPYDPAIVAGGSPSAEQLFYSYPPPVAQTMTALAWLPDGVALVVWAMCATIGLGLVTSLMARVTGHDGLRMSIRAMAVVPLVLPYAIAVLFGNLDVWYPLLYGALVLTVLPGATRPTLAAGGIAVAVVTIAKLHPASLVAWVGMRAVAERGGSQARVLGTATAAGITIVLLSLTFGGVGPWADYVAVVQAGAGSDIVDPRNAAPVSLVGQATGADAALLRVLQVAISMAAVVMTILVAARLRDTLASLAVAMALSLMTLPVTWIHYPVAMIPVGVVLAITRPASRPRLVLAVAVAGLAVAFPAALWLAVAIVVAAAVESAGRTADRGPVMRPAAAE